MDVIVSQLFPSRTTTTFLQWEASMALRNPSKLSVRNGDRLNRDGFTYVRVAATKLNNPSGAISGWRAHFDKLSSAQLHNHKGASFRHAWKINEP